jgi:hypothetical protein
LTGSRWPRSTVLYRNIGNIDASVPVFRITKPPMCFLSFDVRALVLLQLLCRCFSITIIAICFGAFAQVYFVLTNEIQLKFNLVHPSSRYSRTYLQLYTSDRTYRSVQYLLYSQCSPSPIQFRIQLLSYTFSLVVLSLYNMVI